MNDKICHNSKLNSKESKTNMCGIAGYIGKRALSQEQIDSTLKLMKNRGPDQQGATHLQHSNNHVHLLFSRLSIIDLDERSNQPFQIGRYTIVFNGEIYNFKELRIQLEQQGLHFRTQSDTEVLLQAYVHYGESFVEHFEGMWAFAIYDSVDGSIFLSRDRFGEKPIYMMKVHDGIFFASEIKFLRQLSGIKNLQINYRHIQRYLVNGYKSLYKSSDNFFEGIERIPPATLVKFDRRLEATARRYWKLQYQPVLSMNMNEAIERSRELLIESIRIRLRSDVPLAFCLSGGIDSTAIVSIAAKIFNCNVSTYSIIDSDERYNEKNNIDSTVRDLDCKNTSIQLEKSKSLDRLRQLILYHDSPISTLSYYIHSFLMEKIALDNRRVSFSGTSADELFTGYYDHFNLYMYAMRHESDFPQILEEWQAGIGQHVRNPSLQNPYLYMENPGYRDHIYQGRAEFAGYLTSDFTEDFSEKPYTDVCQLRNRMMNELFEEVTPLILHEDDLNAMKYSIENRSPFLDRRLVEHCYTIPTKHLIKDGFGKYILRESLKGIVNEKVRIDKKKKGFNASIQSIIDFKNPNIRHELLDSSPVFDVFRRDKVEALLSQDFYPNSMSKFLFNFINTKLFLEGNV